MPLLPYLVTVAFMAILAFLSLAPSRSAPVRWSPQRLQKTMHVLLYGVLAGLLLWDLQATELAGPWRYFAAWLLACGFGAGMELLQSTRADRCGNWSDVMRNASGAALGIGVAVLLRVFGA